MLHQQKLPPRKIKISIWEVNVSHIITQTKPAALSSIPEGGLLVLKCTKKLRGITAEFSYFALLFYLCAKVRYLLTGV